VSEAVRALAPGLWVADRPFSTGLAELGTRMTIVRLADGGLFLHSPVKLDDATRRALDALGPVRAVVCPSRVHHLFAGDYVAPYPDAKLYGPPGLAEKRKDLRFHATLGDEPEPAWRGVLEQHLFRGHPLLGEVVFFHGATRTLITTDLVFNVPVGRTRGARLFYWLVGAEGRIGPHRLIRVTLRDRKAARASADRILGWDFDRITVTHGDVVERGGHEAFRSGFSFLPR
jgi:hypothetical protein